MKKKIVALALGAACLSAPAAAAMYRCGSTFQDRPCESADQQQTIRPGKGAGSAVVAPQPAAAPSSAPAAAAAAAEGAAHAASAASAPRPASAKDGAQGAPAAAATAVPTSATARTSGTADCGKPRKQGTTLNTRQPAAGSVDPQHGGQKNAGEAGC
jgi:hypothetical protein